jgi:hypothetical protein
MFQRKPALVVSAPAAPATAVVVSAVWFVYGTVVGHWLAGNCHSESPFQRGVCIVQCMVYVNIVRELA